ncbi:Transglutaminase [uncultured Paludibacter sp.]|nr:Transglutaminase [uncultured Paludibacter sp.]
MKKTFLLTFLFIAFISKGVSQNFSLKYGNVTNDELKMKTYDKDTSAVAVVIYNFGSTYYDYSNGFKTITEIRKKIKILKQEGTDEATIVIPYYEENNQYRDQIVGLEAFAYNLENGKIVKSKLEKKYIFEENIRKNYFREKFTIPNAKVGSVIEYKYKIISDRYGDVPDQYMQEDIPIMNIQYEVRIPEYFIYNVETRGYEKINAEKKDGTQNFSIIDDGQIYTVSCTCKDMTYSMTDVPALKDEPYVWDKDDFRSAVTFELNGTNFPRDFYRPYTSTWENIEKTLKEKTDFVSNINKSSPYKDELKTLLADKTNEMDKIETIYAFIKKNVKWNDNYAFWDNEPKDAVKKGTGTNAQINSLLIRALKDAGFNAYPILISQRSYGRLPYTYPSIDKLSTYLVGVQTSEGKNVYLDGSSKYGGINMLPVELLVDRGYVMDANVSEKWVNLTSLTKNMKTVYINAKLTPEGKLQADMNRTFSNLESYYYKNTYKSAKDSADYIEKFETKNNLKIDSLQITGIDLLSNTSQERMVFTKDFEINGDFIYLNPMLFTHISENKFTQSDRKLPIEFPYPEVYNYYANIQIPEDYAVSELPKSSRILLNDNQGKCTYMIGQVGNMIQINYKFELNQILYPTTDYPMIRDFWGQVATKNNEMIVLKKL